MKLTRGTEPYERVRDFLCCHLQFSSAHSRRFRFSVGYLRPKFSPRRPIAMEFRQLGKSGLQVPVLCFGTGTFGGGGEFFRAWGETDVAEATKLIDICMEAGVNFFDTADMYSQG